MKQENTNLIVFRAEHNRNYKTINLTCVQDKRLSWKAKGLHNYFITRPGDWEMRMEELKSRSMDGITSLYSGLNELIKYGYVFRTRKRNEKKQIIKGGYYTAETPKTIEEVIPLIEDSGWEINQENLNTENLSIDFVSIGNKIPSNKNIISNKDIVSNEYKGDLLESRDSKSNSDELPVDFDSEQPPLPNQIKQPLPNQIKSLLSTLKQPTIKTNRDPYQNNTPQAKEIFLYWNSLGGPLPIHRENEKSKTFTGSLDAIDSELNRDNTVPEIKQAIKNYYDLLLMEHNKLSIATPGFKVSLQEFFHFSPITKKRMKQRKSSVDVVSWFQECFTPWESLRQKYTQEVKDIYPEITQEFRNIIYDVVEREKFSFDEENTLKRAAVKTHDYFSNLKDYEACGESCVKQVIKALRNNGDDKNLQRIPYWLASDRFFNDTVDLYLRENRFIVDGYDGRCRRQEEERVRRRESEKRWKAEEDERIRKEVLCEADYM